MMRLIRSFLLIIFMCLTACSSQPQKAGETLYQQLGEQKGIERIVDNFIQEVVKDKQIFPYFAKASVSHFRQGFILHLCDVSNGPCQYDGDSMVDIHTGMNISEGHFNRVVELLITAMEKAEVNFTAQNRLLARLAPLRVEVIKR